MDGEVPVRPPHGGEEAPGPETVAAALAALHPDQRRALIQTYYRGRTAAEAAAALGVPVSTVKSRVLDALRELRAACGTAPEGDDRPART